VFNVTSSQQIATTIDSGKVLIDLPIDYEERNTVLNCYPISNMGSELACEQRYRKIYLDGQTSVLNGQLVMNITDIENPLDAVITKM